MLRPLLLFIITIALCIPGGNIHAQELAIGLRTGLSLASFHPKNNIDLDLEYTKGFSIGVPLLYKWRDMWSFQTELSWIQKGSHLSSFNQTEYYDETYHLNYVEWPLMIRVQFGALNPHFFAFGGWYTAYGFGGRYQLYSLINGNYTSVDEKLDFKEDYLETLDYGVHGGVGVCFEFERGLFFIDGRGQRGLVNLNKDKLQPFLSNKALCPHLGYLVYLNH